jgi:hypothetical protein
VILVDSSGWIEFFIDGPRADRYASYLNRPVCRRPRDVKGPSHVLQITLITLLAVDRLYSPW